MPRHRYALIIFAFASLAMLVACRAIAPPTPVRPPLPTNHSLYREPLAIYSDFELPDEQQVLEEMMQLRQDVNELLNLPTSKTPVHVFLFRTEDGYRQYMRDRYPQLPERRSFFIFADKHLKVFTWWGDRVNEDLRHELTHAYVHAAVGDVPLWADEGIAELLESPRDTRGLHRQHAMLLEEAYRREQWQPNLLRLESITRASDMQQMDYAESWLWVHWLIASPDRRGLLQQYLGTKRDSPHVDSIAAELAREGRESEKDVLRHLREVGGPSPR